MKCRTLLLQRLYLPLSRSKLKKPAPRTRPGRIKTRCTQAPHTEVCSGKASGAQGGASAPRASRPERAPCSQRQKKQEPKPEKVFTPSPWQHRGEN